jgi:alpha-beta hydrolase superfamily lysophospholipase
MPQTVTLYGTGGVRLEGDLYLGEVDGPAVGIVLCLGFGSVKEQVAEWGNRLAGRGFVVLVVDYRGFGASDGVRGRVFPLEQVDDLRSAVTYLTCREEVDSARIAVVGISTGGANAVYTAGLDRRVGAVATIVGWGSGERHMRSVRRQHEWLEFQRRVVQARTCRVLSGVDEQINPDDVLVRDPEAAQWRAAMVGQFPEMDFRTSMESAERIVEFSPEAVLPYEPVRPLLVIHAERDMLVPPEEAFALYERAAEPKRLVILPGAQHHDIHQGSAFETCVEEVVRWLELHLGDDRTRLWAERITPPSAVGADPAPRRCGCSVVAAEAL